MDKHALGKKLLDLQDEVDTRKEKRSELQGEQKSILRRLKMEFSADGAAEIDNLLIGLDGQIEEISGTISSKVEEVEGILFGGQG